MRNQTAQQYLAFLQLLRRQSIGFTGNQIKVILTDQQSSLIDSSIVGAFRAETKMHMEAVPAGCHAYRGISEAMIKHAWRGIRLRIQHAKGKVHRGRLIQNPKPFWEPAIMHYCQCKNLVPRLSSDLSSTLHEPWELFTSRPCGGRPSYALHPFFDPCFHITERKTLEVEYYPRHVATIRSTASGTSVRTNVSIPKGHVVQNSATAQTYISGTLVFPMDRLTPPQYLERHERYDISGDSPESYRPAQLPHPTPQDIAQALRPGLTNATQNASPADTPCKQVRFQDSAIPTGKHRSTTPVHAIPQKVVQARPPPGPSRFQVLGARTVASNASLLYFNL